MTPMTLIVNLQWMDLFNGLFFDWLFWLTFLMDFFVGLFCWTILLDFFVGLFCWIFLLDFFVGLFCWTFLLDYFVRLDFSMDFFIGLFNGLLLFQSLTSLTLLNLFAFAFGVTDSHGQLLEMLSHLKTRNAKRCNIQFSMDIKTETIHSFQM